MLVQLPKTMASFVAKKEGSAATYAFREQGVIRLTPAAKLSGTVTGPGGEPLAGVEVVLFTAFMWHFERAVTDAEGDYFHDLRARCPGHQRMDAEPGGRRQVQDLAR